MNYHPGSKFNSRKPVTPPFIKPSDIKIFNPPLNRSEVSSASQGKLPAGPDYGDGRRHLHNGSKNGKNPQKIDRTEIIAAIRSFAAALVSQPEHFLILGDLGFCHFLLGEYIESFSYYKRAVDQDPENPLCQVYYNDMGTACQKRGDIQGAYYYYDKAIALIEQQGYRFGKSSFPYKNRALLNKKNNCFKEALDDIEKAIKIEGKNGSNHAFYQKIKDEICWVSGLTSSF